MDARRTSTAGTRRVRRLLLDYRASIDDQGRIAAWEADIYLPERPMQRSGVTLLAATLAQLPKYGPSSTGILQPRPGYSVCAG